jgi:hypothetical protein
MNPRGRESVRGRCSEDEKYRGRAQTPGSLAGSGGRGSIGGRAVVAVGAGAAAGAPSDGGGGRGATGKGGSIGTGLLTIGVEGTTGVVRAGSGTPGTGSAGTGALEVHDGRPHVTA